MEYFIFFYILFTLRDQLKYKSRHIFEIQEKKGFSQAICNFLLIKLIAEEFAEKPDVLWQHILIEPFWHRNIKDYFELIRMSLIFAIFV